MCRILFSALFVIEYSLSVALIMKENPKIMQQVEETIGENV